MIPLLLVDATRFELATSASRTQRSTKLSHASIAVLPVLSLLYCFFPFFQGHAIIYKSLVNSAKQTLKNIEAWLSLVERCVRDAEVASSNLVASTYLNTKACWSSGQDDALSRRKPGFDSRTGHRKLLWVFQSIFQIKMLPWLSW